MKKRILSACIAILVMLTSFPAMTFAASAGKTVNVPLHYVALGDAAVTGRGMAQNAGYGVATKGAYPTLIRDTLNARGFQVDLAQLGMEGMRTTELRFLLDGNYAGDLYLKTRFPDLSKYRATFQNKIQKADLISYALGAEDFENCLLNENLLAYVLRKENLEGLPVNAESIPLPGNPGQNPDEIVPLAEADADGIRAEFEPKIEEVLSKIPDTIGEKDISAYKAAAKKIGSDAIAYVYYAFCFTFDETIRLIREKNPNAAIVALEISNPLKDLTNIIVMGEQVPIGTFGNSLFQKVNAHIRNTPGIYYAETEGTSRFLDEIASYKSENPKTISAQFKDFCDVYEKNLQLKKAISGVKLYPTSSGLSGAYDTAATFFSDAAKVGTGEAKETALEFNTNFLLDVMEELKNMDQDRIAQMVMQLLDLYPALMTKLKETSLKYAQLPSSSYLTYLRLDMKNGAFYKSDKVQYGDNFSENDKKTIGRLIMMISMHTQMGSGFFPYPSANGHVQLKNAILSKVNDYVVKCDVFAPTCTTSGCSAEFYQTIAGESFVDEGCTVSFDKTLAYLPATGHRFSAWKVVKKAAVCTDGLKQRVCLNKNCTVKETQILPGYAPPKTKITKVKAGKNAFAVAWKKPAKKLLPYTKRYEIRYSLKANMKKAKAVAVKGNKTVVKTIKKLKAKKVYYVQVRYVVVKGGKVYRSPWSAKKAVKTK